MCGALTLRASQQKRARKSVSPRRQQLTDMGEDAGASVVVSRAQVLQHRTPEAVHTNVARAQKRAPLNCWLVPQAEGTFM